MESYPDFDKLVRVIQHGPQGFIVKNIEGESTDANDFLSYFVEVGLLREFQMLPTFSQNLTLQEAFQSVAQIKS